ncbi:hypothetical protein [Pseudoflavonifractor sp. MSJ-37]|uniref:hypothetical protein n=1 Tax=Pseudoflavonifractor sp. MSJ-37 TaxID=2841531 RepID=UPI001C0FA739|nr:hypothetical protein [Pseudoflavonifractor sp. MSJ-37]MBU5434930.1 hypothetical protein [Pseudoflavonifractor sp. MSJ-37]
MQDERSGDSFAASVEKWDIARKITENTRYIYKTFTFWREKGLAALQKMRYNECSSEGEEG